MADFEDRDPRLDSDDAREYVAAILEDIAKNGLPGPRDLDVALDAIWCAVEDDLEKEKELFSKKFTCTGDDHEWIDVSDVSLTMDYVCNQCNASK